MKKGIDANDFYMDYVNNYLTVATIALDYGIKRERAMRLIVMGSHLSVGLTV